MYQPTCTQGNNTWSPLLKISVNFNLQIINHIQVHVEVRHEENSIVKQVMQNYTKYTNYMVMVFMATRKKSRTLHNIKLLPLWGRGELMTGKLQLYFCFVFCFIFKSKM